MDQEKLNLFAKVKLLSRKAGFEVDLARMMADDVYATHELDRFIASGVPELVEIAEKAKLKLQKASAASTTVPIAPAPALASSVNAAEDLSAKVEPAATEKKYVRGVRG
jgi:hypothetical protein